MGWAATENCWNSLWNSLFLIFLSPGFATSNSKHHCFLKQKNKSLEVQQTTIFLSGLLPSFTICLSEGLSSSKTTWWFQRLFIFTPRIGEDEPIMTSISFKGVGSTTNWEGLSSSKRKEVCHFCKWRTCRLQGK